MIAPDLLGFGRSPKPRDARYTPADHIAALHDVLSQRTGGAFALLGHSLGSLIALHYAAAYPEQVRSLVLVSLPVVDRCCWGHRQDGTIGRWHQLSIHSRVGQVIANLGMRVTSPTWSVVGPWLRPNVPRGASQDTLNSTWRSYWQSLENVVYGTSVPTLVSALTMPITIIHGPADRVTAIDPVRTLVQTHPALRLIEIAGAGHNPYFTHPGATLAAIDEALRKA